MKFATSFLLLLALAVPSAAQNKAKVIEEIVARVNNEIVTTSDLVRARATLQEEARADCRGCTPAQLEQIIADRGKNLLRDLIDQLLLAQRAKDMNINVETDVVKRLDQIRQQNNIADMEALEKRIGESGISFEDFKDQIRKQLLSQEVIRREVGPRVHSTISRDDVRKFYEEHKKEFDRPEAVALREIFVSTDGKTETEILELEKKAKNLLDRVKRGDDFEELAKRHSDGSTAKTGGELGVFRRGQLDKTLEDVVFKLDRNKVTDVVRTKTGFLILQVAIRYEAGIQPLEKVEGEIMNQLYYSKMEPALRDYLTTLRRESYIVLKPGYVDSAGVASSPIQEVEPGASGGKEKEDDSGSSGRRWYWPFGGGGDDAKSKKSTKPAAPANSDKATNPAEKSEKPGKS